VVTSVIVVNLVQFLRRNVFGLVFCCLVLLTEFVKIQDFLFS
jgi:hypothetical protein